MTADQGKSATEIVGDIVGNVQDIVRAEVRLAGLELRDEALKLKQAAVLGAAAAFVALLGLGWLLYAFIQMLALAISLWAAALIVSVAALAIAGILALTAKRKIGELAAPLPKTRASVREIARWTQTHEH